MKKILSAIIIGLAALSFANAEKLSVVTTVFPAYDWACQIIGTNNADITMLLDNGVDLHSYQPTVKDIAKISECDLFIYVGGESDEWVEDVLERLEDKKIKTVNLLEVAGNEAKIEEVKEGMEAHEHEHEHGHTDGHSHKHKKTHSHGVSKFEDSEVKDRTLKDWQGEWQSVYPYLLNGTLNSVMEHKAEKGNKTAEEYFAYYKKGYDTDVEKIKIKGSKITFTKNGKSVTATYEYKGFRTFTYTSGNRGARFQYEAKGNAAGAPKYIQFSDHEIEPSDPAHFHLYFGDESFDALSEEMEHWPTYYPADYDGDDIVEDMIGHHHGDHEEEAEEYDEHVWLSLKLAMKLTKAITDAVISIDSSNAESYRKNLTSYNDKLMALDKKYAQTAADSKFKTVVFADRFPFRYMVEDYNLDYYAAFAGCSAETEASFKTVAFLANKADELKLNSIFVIEGANKKIAKTVNSNSKNKNRKILTMDSMQSSTSKDYKKGKTYLSVMEANLKVLSEGLN